VAIPLPTQPFRDEHAHLRQHLEHVRAWVGEIPTLPAEARAPIAERVVGFLEAHVVPHAEWEERVLYATVDRYAGGAADFPFTSSMRREHHVLGRWIGELRERIAQKAWIAFCRRADNLLGLLEAHLECEEEVALPVLDQQMTPEAYRAEVGITTH
jgi:hemerythrin-like domain-containing protein